MQKKTRICGDFEMETRVKNLRTSAIFIRENLREIKNYNLIFNILGKLFKSKKMTENEISYKIRGCIFKVYNTFGPGLLESAYEIALAPELEKEGLSVKRQVGLPLIYDDIKMEVG